MPTKIIHPYGTKNKVRLNCGTDSMTKQSFRDECNINNILKKYQKTGAIEHANNHAPEYGFATALSFTESMFIVTKAQALFDDLPSSLRTKFNNDPGEFLEFTQNPENASEMAELGLIPSPDTEVSPEPSNTAPAASETPVTANAE